MGAAAAAVVLVAAGPDQARSVLLGILLVCGFFLFGALNTGLAAAYAPALSLLVALLTYTLQIVVLGAMLVWVRRADPPPAGLDPAWLGGTVVAGTLLWTVVLVLRALRDPGVGR
jgi:ATP synthase protein I